MAIGAGNLGVPIVARVTSDLELEIQTGTAENARLSRFHKSDIDLLFQFVARALLTFIP